MIYILLIKEDNEEEDIYAHNCPFEHILVRKQNKEIIGRYVAVQPIGEDCLSRYR